MSFLIKVCGVTTADDAAMVAEAGADAVGLDFWPRSSRFVDERRGAAIVAALPRGVLKVGVFVNAHPLVVAETVAELRLDRVQLHGTERVADFAHATPKKLMRTIRVHSETSLDEAAAWDVDLFVYQAEASWTGGPGVGGPLDLIARSARRPFLLSGGLTPENVAAAVRATRPNGVNVTRGVEGANGRKDASAVRAFIANARAAAAALAPDDAQAR